MSRVPIRVRLVLGFAVVMAAVLGLTGAFIYDRTRDDLNDGIQRELEARMAATIAIVRDDGDDLGDPQFDPLDRLDAGGVVQVLAPGPRIADATSEQLLDEVLITQTQLDDLRSGAVDAVEVDSPLGPLRVIAGRTQDDGVRYIPIVAAPLTERDQALDSLSQLLLIGGPVALLLASLAAYGVATAALRPVETMRRGAERIGGDDPSGRLPVGRADDEITRLGLTLNELLERLEESLRRERRFVADASHELRTPLTILRSQIDLALEGGADPATLRMALESCGEEVDRMTRLSSDLLVLARSDEGRIPTEPRAIPLDAFAADIAAGFDQAEVIADVPAGTEVIADPDRLRQAVANLVENALLHGAAPVRITAAAGDGERVISVSDSGPGFPEDLRGRETERFARGKASRSTPGSGLGLAIVDAIAVAHGGSVSIGGAPGGGAEVALHLPDRS